MTDGLCSRTAIEHRQRDGNYNRQNILNNQYKTHKIQVTLTYI